MNKGKEALKTTLLCGLIILSVILAMFSWTMDEYFYSAVSIKDVVEIAVGQLRLSSSGPPAHTSGPSDNTFTPLKAVYSEGGYKYMLSSDRQTMQDFGKTLRRAVSASLSVPGVSLTLSNGLVRWDNALKTNHMLVDFGSELNLSAYMDMIGAKPAEDLSGLSFRRMIIAPDSEENEIDILFKTSEGSAVHIYCSYVPDSAVTLFSMAKNEGEDCGLLYAFEYNESFPEILPRQIASETLISRAPVTLPRLAPANSLEASGENAAQKRRELISAFGFSHSSVNVYDYSDGRVSYVDNSLSSLEISVLGNIRYVSSQKGPGIPVFNTGTSGAILLRRYDMVNACYAMLSSIESASVESAAILQLSDISYGNGIYTLRFDYYYKGMRIDLGEPAATFNLQGGYIKSAVIRPKSFVPTSETKKLISQTDAIRIHALNYGPTYRHYLDVTYFEDADTGLLNPFWS